MFRATFSRNGKKLEAQGEEIAWAHRPGETVGVLITGSAGVLLYGSFEGRRVQIVDNGAAAVLPKKGGGVWARWDLTAHPRAADFQA